MTERNYKIKNIEDLAIGDIIFVEVDEYGYPLYRYLLLSDIYLAYCLETDETFVLSLNDTDIVYFIGNICDLIPKDYSIYTSHKVNKDEIKEDDSYVWLGIQYGDIKILMNLKDATIETYDKEKDEWTYVDIDVTEKENTFIITVENVKFKVNLDTMKILILTPDSLRFKKYNNYILGKNGEYVFNSENELSLS